MKKVISILVLLFFLMSMIPLPGFCEDNKKDNATSGAATAGTAAGEETFMGMHTGTIAVSVIIIAAVAVLLVASGRVSTTTNN